MQRQKEEFCLLLRVEQIKFRKAGPGKSPLGTFSIYEDHVEWINTADKSDQLLIHLSKIKGLRLLLIRTLHMLQ